MPYQGLQDTFDADRDQAAMPAGGGAAPFPMGLALAAAFLAAGVMAMLFALVHAH